MFKKGTCALACIALASCDVIEMSSQQYDSYKVAADSQALGEWKWLPAGLPKSALNIKETHDIDTNEVWFSYTDPQHAVPSGCIQVQSPSAKAPRSKGIGEARRVPKVAASLIESREAPVFSCEGETYRYMVAVDVSANQVIGWSIRPTDVIHDHRLKSE